MNDDVRVEDAITLKLGEFNDDLATAFAPSGALVQSVAELGVLVPILITTKSSGNGRTVILDGKRRAIAAIAAGHETIPAVHVSSRNPASTVIARLAAHGLRSDNMTDEFFAFAELEGTEEENLTGRTGFAANTIAKRMRLGDLPYRALIAAQEGRIAPTVLEKMANARPEVVTDLMTLLAAKKSITGTDVQGAILKHTPPTEIPPYLRQDMLEDVRKVVRARTRSSASSEVQSMTRDEWIDLALEAWDDVTAPTP